MDDTFHARCQRRRRRRTQSQRKTSMLDTLLLLTSRIWYQKWLAFLFVTSALPCYCRCCCSFHLRQYTSAFLPPHPSLYPKTFLSSSSGYDNSVRPLSSLSTGRRPTRSAGQCYSFSLKAAPRGSSKNQNGRQQSRQPQPSNQRKQQQFLSVNDVLDDYVKNGSNLKTYQVGLVWNKLGKAVQQSHNKREWQNFWSNHEADLRTLVAHTIQLVNDFDGQSTATVTHSLAKIMALTDSNLSRVQSLWNALLVHTAMHLKLDGFNAQEVSNILWAYAKADKGKTTHPRLLDALANAALLRVGDFKPQELSNIAWAYATMNHEAPLLFNAIAKAGQMRIDDFKPQELANTAWAFARLNHHAPPLFDAIAKASQACIDDFIPQNIANTAWAFATLDYKSPLLFNAIARMAQICIDDFKPQELSNTAWSFATLSHRSPALFRAIATTAQKRIDNFKPQELSNMAWSFATLNHEAPLLFDAIAQKAQERSCNFNPQQLSNTAWAFAVLNVGTNLLTGGDSTLAQTLLSTKPTSFSVEALSQLHQFHLWCKEKNTPNWFPDALSCRCLNAFVSTDETSSGLQINVVRSLERLQEVSQVQEEFRTKIGYSLDAVIVYRGSKLGVEVDGPSHFVGRSQRTRNGNTILKHRQLRNLEGYKLVSIPYWEWNEVCDAARGSPTLESNKQAYLRNLLDETCKQSVI